MFDIVKIYIKNALLYVALYYNSILKKVIKVIFSIEKIFAQTYKYTATLDMKQISFKMTKTLQKYQKLLESFFLKITLQMNSMDLISKTTMWFSLICNLSFSLIKQ